jgi:hypothetical protein
MGRTCVVALIIEKPLDDTIVQSLNDTLKPATVVSTTVSERHAVSISLSETDLRIIKCLLFSGARTEISEIAREVGILRRPPLGASLG